MKVWKLGAVALAIAFMFNVGTTQADPINGYEVHDGAVLDGGYGQNCGCQPACGSCCDLGGGGSWIVDFETTWLRYHRNDNLQTDNFFDFEFSPRLTVGYQDCDGMGVRLRWWDYDHNGTGTFNGNVNANINVDTYNIDFELYQNVQVTPCTSVEFSGGIRYNDFSEVVTTAGGALIQADTFSAYGAIFGIKARRQMLNGAMYARWNTSILMSDHNAVNGHGLEFDQVLTQTELGLGYEYTTCLSTGILTLRAGIEYSIWNDYVHDNADADDNTAVGFGGFVFGAAYQF